MTELKVLCMFVLLSSCANSQPSDKKTECYCVPSNMCLDNDVDINNGAGILDIRMKNELCKWHEICCKNPQLLATRSTTIKCGIRTLTVHNMRIGSESNTAQFGEVPWTVAILMEDSNSESILLHRCGGSLIHPEMVMTAAHCVVDIPNAILLVKAGEWNTTSEDEPLPHQQRYVHRIFVHPFYHPANLKYDVALLLLTKPLELAENVGVICLPPIGMRLDKVKCVASGWGKHSFEGDEHSRILKTIALPLVNHADCERLLRKTRLGQFYHLHESFLCAGGEPNRDTCTGDGGSPLVCPIPHQPGRYLQMGIVAWGIGCGQHGVPGVYVNVPEIRNWLDHQLNILHIDIDVYNYQ